MKHIHLFYRFFGGITFALLLIATVALFVIVGTIIESWTQSHRYAAAFTYDNPFFIFLLWGFFLNILLSATRRWPFKWKHLPFLTTHFGLLMILAGGLAKHYFGLQGSMSLLEGTGSEQIMEANTYAIQLSQKHNPMSISYPLKKSWNGKFVSEIETNDKHLKIRLAEFYPHSMTYLANWIKNEHAMINGLKAMPIYRVTNREEWFPISGKARFHHSEADVWNLFALKADNMEETLHQLYAQYIRLEIKNRLTQEAIANVSLNEPFHLPDGTSLKASLSLPFSSLEGFQNPTLTVSANFTTHMIISLDGGEALLNKNCVNPELGDLAWSVDISLSPLLAIFEDEEENVFMIAFDKHGKVWSEPFRKGHLESLTAYDDGYSGYTARSEPLFKSYNTGREEREQAMNYQLALQLRQAEAEDMELSPPLKILQNACLKSNADFPNTLVSFLSYWNNSSRWLYPKDFQLPQRLREVFLHLNWKEASDKIQQGCEWSVKLFEQLDFELAHNNDLLHILKNNNWPLLAALEDELSLNKSMSDQKASLYMLLTLQLFAAAERLPMTSLHHQALLPEEQAALLSAYLRAYDIHLSTIMPRPLEVDMDNLIRQYQTAKLLSGSINQIFPAFANLSRKEQESFIASLENDAVALKEVISTIQEFGEQMGIPEIAALTEPQLLAKVLAHYLCCSDDKVPTPTKADLLAPQVVLETPLIPIQKPLIPNKKLEENIPKITLFISEPEHSQSISLSYEPTGSGLKWPILNGKYLIRFQPQFKSIPYHVRLRQARQINYPNSSQPYSFESDLIVQDLRSNSFLETTISMNKVHQTWDGYRFYLSSMTPANETAVKHVQIIVNYDPTKYWLTYPGAIVLSCGILMLFIMRPYRRPKL